MTIQFKSEDVKDNYCSLNAIIIHWKGLNCLLPKEAFTNWKCSQNVVERYSSDGIGSTNKVSS